MKHPFRITWITALLLLLYLGWVFGSRWWTSREASQAVKERFDPLPPALSTPDLKILHFYASPGRLPRGEAALLCYGVLNATSVRLEPAVEEIKPSLNRCLEIRPLKTTEYRLTAGDASGQTVTAVFTLEVSQPR